MRFQVRVGWLLASIVFATLAVVSLAWAASQQQPSILETISCPVYQAPETPHPSWPRQCGGQRDVGGATSEIDLVLFTPSIVFGVLSVVSFRRSRRSSLPSP